MEKREGRESFVFYKSFSDAIELLEPADQLLLYRAISVYSTSGKVIRLTSLVARAMWLLIKPLIDANWQKYSNGCKGGAPTGNSNATKTTTKQSKTTEKQPKNNRKQPNDNVNVDENANENVNVFDTPTLEEIELYLTENELDSDAASFHDYYSSRGWMLGNTPMSDWRAALRSWNRREWSNNERRHGVGQQSAGNDEGEFSLMEYDEL